MYTHKYSSVRAYVAWPTESRAKATKKKSKRKSDESGGIIALSSPLAFSSLLLN